MSDRLIRDPWATAPMPPADGEDNHEEQSVLRQFLDYLGLLRRHPVVVAMTFAGALAVLAYQFQHAVPSYRATAVVRYQDKAQQLSGGLGAMNNQLGGTTADPLLTQIQLLKSRGVAREVVQREGLRLHVAKARANGDLVRDVVVDSAAPADTMELAFGHADYTLRSGHDSVTVPYGTPALLHGVKLTASHAAAQERVAIEVTPVEREVDDFLRVLNARPRERTDIIDVTYEAPSPRAAQRIANTTVHVFQEMNAREAKQESARRRQFVEGQLAQTTAKLADAMAAHNGFQSREQVFSAEDRLRAQQMGLTDIESQRQQLAADRSMYAALLAALTEPHRAGSSTDRLGALVSSPGIAANPIVAQLSTQLVKLELTRDSLTSGQWGVAAGNPDVKQLDQLIASTQGKIVTAVRAQLGAADAKLQSLEALRRRSGGVMSALPRSGAEEAQLLARVDAFSKEADRLREELQKAQIEEAAEGGQIDIVDLATLPTLPIGSGKLPRVVLAFLIALGLASAVAYVMENYTAVIRRREDLERIVALPNLAIIPALVAVQRRGARLLPWAPRQLTGGHGAGGPVRDGRELVAVHDGRSNGAEAFRTLRTNILFSAVSGQQRKIIVTSAGPADGKSTTAANLAVAFAQQGYRVLLVDCDLRRPRVHEVFALQQLPGLTNVLLGSVVLAEAVRQTGIDGLSVLPAGAIPPNPAELLGSPQTQELLEKLAASHDVVIMDTPPVLVASDAVILGRHADGALLVVRAGRTQAAALRDALERLGTVGVRVLGTVLNDPDGEVAKFARYYGQYHASYYGSNTADV